VGCVGGGVYDLGGVRELRGQVSGKLARSASVRAAYTAGIWRWVMAGSILSSFLDGFTGGNFFTRVGRPGAPTQVFADPDSDDYPQKELVTALLAIQRAEDLAREQADELQAVSTPNAGSK